MNDNLLLTVIEKFSAGDIGELDLTSGTTHLILRKKGVAASASFIDKPVLELVRRDEVAAPTPRAPRAVKENAAPQGVALNQDELDAVFKKDAPIPAPAQSAAKTETITSPIVATFYAAAGPDSPPIVVVGDKVKAGSTLCILEAMKMMNHLEAEFDCEILAIKAATSDLVEYGQTLFEVKRLTQAL
jgi:acetyl-CoA carboxylase biotin carboxyl carrier protein